MNTERWVRELWKGGHGVTGTLVRTGLLPAEIAFRAVTAVRSLGFASGVMRRSSVSVPVIGVGNLTVGGTGKTPIASWVVRTLQDAGASPALVARGYGRDELELHRSWTPEAGIHADADRVAAAKTAVAEGASVVVLDDGFQHLRLVRDLDVVLVSAEQGLTGPRLPRGPFREGPGALSRAGVVIVTRKSADAGRAAEIEAAVAVHAPLAVRASVHLAPSDFSTLHGAPASTPEEARVLTAVALPRTVGSGAESLGVRVDGLHAFPDHHDFTDAEVASALRGWDGPVVVTEKDAVKLAELPSARGADIRVLRQRVAFTSGEAAVRAAILRAAGLEDGRNAGLDAVRGSP